MSLKKKIYVSFSQNEAFHLRESSKSAFSIERHCNVGPKMRKNDVFGVRYLENDNGDPSFLFQFLIEGVKMYNIRKYE